MVRKGQVDTMKQKTRINVIVSAIVILVIAIISVLIINYYIAISSENPSDICKTPSGYTDEQWRTHMSHHPDRYAQCFT